MRNAQALCSGKHRVPRGGPVAPDRPAEDDQPRIALRKQSREQMQGSRIILLRLHRTEHADHQRIARDGPAFAPCVAVGRGAGGAW